ncbi:leucine-rich repeat, cysteine-containing subtype protein [Tanacetum coccineum]
MKLIAQSCPNIEHLDLSKWCYLDHEMDKLELDDVGLVAIANACGHLVDVNLAGSDLGLEYLANGKLMHIIA